MRRDYFSMNSIIVQNKRPTPRSGLSAGMPLGDGKAAVLAEPAQLAKYIMSIHDLCRREMKHLSEKVGDSLVWRSMPVRSTLAGRQQAECVSGGRSR